MANKKKRTPPRPQGGSRPAPKRPGQPASGAKPGGPAKPSTGGANQAPKPAAGAAKAAAKAPRERTGPTRAERLAAAEAARRRKAARTRGLVAGGLVAVLALLTITIINSRRSNDRVVSRLEESGACAYDSKTDSDSGAGRNHIAGDLTYKVNPPSGGNHNTSSSPPGVFTLENTPPDGQVVHSLEHGYVVIWYKPDLDAAGLEDLKELTGKYARDVLLVPRASLTEVPVAATAWHRRVLCQRADVGALEEFVKAYRNKGPEKVPH
jgi:hypothetical protein